MLTSNVLVIGVGSAANDNTGDPLRTAFQKINSNFAGLYNGGQFLANITSSATRPSYAWSGNVGTGFYLKTPNTIGVTGNVVLDRSSDYYRGNLFLGASSVDQIYSIGPNYIYINSNSRQGNVFIDSYNTYISDNAYLRGNVIQDNANARVYFYGDVFLNGKGLDSTGSTLYLDIPGWNAIQANSISSSDPAAANVITIGNNTNGGTLNLYTSNIVANGNVIMPANAVLRLNVESSHYLFASGGQLYFKNSTSTINLSNGTSGNINAGNVLVTGDIRVDSSILADNVRANAVIILNKSGGAALNFVDDVNDTADTSIYYDNIYDHMAFSVNGNVLLALKANANGNSISFGANVRTSSNIFIAGTGVTGPTLYLDVPGNTAIYGDGVTKTLTLGTFQNGGTINLYANNIVATGNISLPSNRSLNLNVDATHRLFASGGSLFFQNTTDTINITQAVSGAGVTSVNGKTGAVTLYTDNIIQTVSNVFVSNTTQTFFGMKVFDDNVILDGQGDAPGGSKLYLTLNSLNQISANSSPTAPDGNVIYIDANASRGQIQLNAANVASTGNILISTNRFISLNTAATHRIFGSGGRLYFQNATSTLDITGLQGGGGTGDVTSVTAGSGLTGTSESGPDVTLNVGQGDGITVSADAVAVDASVVRTSNTSYVLTSNTSYVLIAGTQTITGTKTFSGTTYLNSTYLTSNTINFGAVNNKGSIYYSLSSNTYGLSKAGTAIDVVTFQPTGITIDGTSTLPKATGSTSNFLRADGSWATPPDTDTNTTYGISAETATSGANIRITGSDSSIDNVNLIGAGTVSIARTDANTITITGSGGGGGDVTSVTAGSGLTGSSEGGPDVTLNVGQGDGITVSADAVAVDASVVRTSNTSYVLTSNTSYVLTATNQTLTGVKTFTSPILSQSALWINAAANTNYPTGTLVDVGDNISLSVKTPSTTSYKAITFYGSDGKTSFPGNLYTTDVKFTFGGVSKDLIGKSDGLYYDGTKLGTGDVSTSGTQTIGGVKTFDDGLVTDGITLRYGNNLFIPPSSNTVSNNNRIYNDGTNIRFVSNGTEKTANWDTAYGWGNHASAGYGYSNFSGSYTDLSNKPTIPSNTNQLTNGSGYITLSSLSFTAGSGGYNSGSGVITIPTNTNQLTNGANFITSSALAGYATENYVTTRGYITSYSETDTLATVTARGTSTNQSLSTGSLTVTGSITATGEITAYYSSDERLKENVAVIQNPLEKLLSIRGVNFDWTEDYINSRGGEDGYFVRKQDIGVIAQEIEKVLPEVVAKKDDGYKAVRYEKIVPLLIEAIKEQQSQIEELKELVKRLAK